MSKTIQLLEQMGSNANCQSTQAIEELLAQVEVNTEQAKAIIDKDIATLERQLSILPVISCSMFPAEDEDSSDEKQENEEDDNDTNLKVILSA